MHEAMEAMTKAGVAAAGHLGVDESEAMVLSESKLSARRECVDLLVPGRRVTVTAKQLSNKKTARSETSA